MKKIIILLIPILLFGCAPKKEIPKPIITNILNETEYASKVKLSNFIQISNGKLKDYVIDTYSLGNKKVNFKYTDLNNKTYSSFFTLSVKDTTKPLLLNKTSFTVKTGTKDLDLVSKMMCGDNYDRNLVCTVNGNYDINTPGEYNLSFEATDSSGNKTVSPFKLIVKNEIDTSTYTREDQNINDIISAYKNDNTKIGIDVSSWQEDIDWNTVKNAGIEFAMIRIGHEKSDGTYGLDNKFLQNIKGAKDAGIKVGIYYYSKASSMDEAIKQANWITDNLNGEKIDLPISFDWESWSDFNSFHISYTDLNRIAESFIKMVESKGYKAMNYGSASYLEKIWNLEEYPTWLAHYTDKTYYDKPYYLWQLSNTGIVPGINSHVDIDIMYLNENKK